MVWIRGLLCGAQLEAWLGAGGAAAALHEDVYGPLTGQARVIILHHLCFLLLEP